MSQTGASSGKNGKSTEKHYDVVIVGAGFAGVLVAKRLAAAGRSVLILEAGFGNSLSPENYRGYVDNFYQALYKTPNSPYPLNDFAPSPTVTDLNQIKPHVPATNGYMVQKGPIPFGSDYERAQGGTSLHWLGCCPRMVPNDFRLNTNYGVGVDWPLSYEDLKPYYGQFEWEIGVSADVEDQKIYGITFEDDYVYPMKKIPQSYLDQRVIEGLRGMKVPIGGQEKEINLTSMAQGRNSVPNRNPRTGKMYRPMGMAGDPYTGERCEGNASCVPICPVQAKYNALKTLNTLDLSLVKIITQAVASNIELDSDTGRVSGITYKKYAQGSPPSSAETCTARGTLYVIAAHAIETAKLLLASGVANSSDQVGRNLMDHTTLLTWGLMPEAVGSYRGPGSTTNIYSFRDGDFRREHAGFIMPIDNWGWTWPVFDPGVTFDNLIMGTSEQKPVFGRELRRACGNTLARQITFHCEIEQLPDPSNRVTIDPKYRDALGNYRPVIEYNISDYERAAMAAGRAISIEVFKRLGVTDCTKYSESAPGYLTYHDKGYVSNGAGHVVGTHRMGGSRWNSVTDTTLRTWDHPNLYLVGCGSMPTLGTSNPSPTMGALALRAADNMLKELL